MVGVKGFEQNIPIKIALCIKTFKALPATLHQDRLPMSLRQGIYLLGYRAVSVTKHLGDSGG